MSGQTKVCSNSIAEEFIKTNNPYKKNEPLQFDLRAYSDYVKENELDVLQITDAVMKKFKK